MIPGKRGWAMFMGFWAVLMVLAAFSRAEPLLKVNAQAWTGIFIGGALTALAGALLVVKASRKNK